MNESTDLLSRLRHWEGGRLAEAISAPTGSVAVSDGAAEQYALAVASALDGLWEWDLRTDSLDLSDRCRRLLGYDRDEIPRTIRFFWDSLHPDDLEAVRTALRCHLEQEGNAPTDVEYRLRTKQGEYRCFRARGLTRRDESGRPILLAGVLQDITDRKQTEQALAERLRFEKLLADLSATFVNLPSDHIEGVIDSSLKMLVESLGIDRSTLGEFTEDQGHVLVTHSYTVAAHNPFPVGAVVDDRLPWYIAQLRLGTALFLRRLPDDLPPEAVKERQHCVAQGIQSNCTVPLKAAGKVLGALTFAFLTRQCDWDREIVCRLQMIGEVFAHALLRKRSDETIRAALAENERLRSRLEQENVCLRERITLQYHQGRIVGKSHALKKVLNEAESVAFTDSPVLLLGETGTGKELLAQRIHELSARRDRPMITVNCAALAATLIESELFGRVAGAYTGAASAQVGRFDVADGSTLFLDEVGEFPIELQAKLLRVLENGRFERLGSPETVTVNVRVIAATNRNLEQAVRDGKFRPDLFYRLYVFPICVPPLRERREDIPELVWNFIGFHSQRMGKVIKSVPREVMDRLQRYSWPGNVRELGNLIERAMILATDTTLAMEVPTTTEPPFRSAVREGMRERILRALEETQWRIRGPGGAVEILDVKPTTLESRMAKLGIVRAKRKSEVS